MKVKILYWLVYIVFCNVILFILCVLPWLGFINLSSWWICAAIPGTTFASIICGEFLIILHEELDTDRDDTIQIEDFFD